MDSEPEQEPQRLSALYQYHNAPEVAPAHGLEYDDTHYPSSDKYPVIHTTPYEHKYTGKHAYNNADNRPPRIIFGMKVRTFLVVAAIMVLIIVGAAVGGAVGGKSVREGQTQDGMAVFHNVTNSSTPTASATPAAPSTYSAPIPTYTPLSDCPNSNNTLYISAFASGSSGTVQPSSSLNFTKYCDYSNPLSNSGSQTLSEAFVYSFNDCIDACASYNFWAGDANCTVAVYKSDGSRPGNCWVGTATTSLSQLKADKGTDVALLEVS